MATTYSSSKVADGVQPKVVETGDVTVVAGYTISAALVINDVFQMVKVPEGATVKSVTLASDDLEIATGTSAALILAVGDGSDVDRFITASTIGQGGGVQAMNNQVGLGYTYGSGDTIDIKVTTAPGTSATAGAMVVVATYTMDP